MVSGRRAGPASVVAALGVGAAGVIGLGVLGTTSLAAAAEPTQQELLEQIRALQSKVEQLEARQQQQAAQQQQQAAQQQQSQPQQQAPAADEKGATVDSVLRDAERRSSPALLQSEGFTAGYSHGKFLIQDAAGNFVLNPNVQFQFRYVANFRKDDAADSDDGENAFDDGFEIRRLKFAFDGSVFGPALTYKFQWATNRGNGNPVLDDAWVRWSLGETFGSGSRDWAIRVGQFKDPFNHEEITSSKRQLAADRSLMNELLAGGLTDWVQGVAFIWDDGPDGSPLRAEIGFSDGPNTDNTNFQNGGGLPAAFPGLGSPNYGAFARVELKARGDWKQYDDFTALGNTKDLLVFGGGLSYAEFGKSDVLFHSADLQYENRKMGLYAAFTGLYSEPTGTIPGGEGAAGDPDDDIVVTAGGTYDWGFLIQAGYMLDRKCELFARFDETFLDDARLLDGAEDSYPEVTVGMNYYIRGHAAKLTIDGVWAPNGIPSDQNGLGLIEPDADEEQFAVRAQFQLLL